MVGGRFAAAMAAFLLLMTLVIASVALADAGESEKAAQTLTPQLIKEATESPTVDMGSPSTDPNAAQQLPHDELGRSEASELLSSVFGSQIESLGGPLEDLQVEKFLSDNAAVVSSDELPDFNSTSNVGEVDSAGPASAEPVLIESSLPLRTDDSEGQDAPVDLSLHESEGELQPVNPLVEAGIPLELGDGISLLNDSVSLSFPDATQARSPSVVEGNTAFYPNVQTDTDLAVTPTPEGVETFTQLRTPEAPLAQTIHVGLPAGAILEEVKGGGAKAELNGRTLLTVPAPVAVDAQGDDVPMSLTVTGPNLELSVAPSESAAYPILVDPDYQMEAWNWTWENNSLANWEPVSSTASYASLPYTYWDPNHFKGLDMTSGFPGSAKPSDAANWFFHVPRFWADKSQYQDAPQSYISMAEIEGVNFLLHGNNAAYPLMVAGIIDESAGWVSMGTHSGSDGEITGWAGNYFYPNYGDTNAKYFVVALQTGENEAQAEWRDAFVAKAAIGFGDHNAPQLTKATGPSGWMDKTETGAIGYTAIDPGLGVYEVRIAKNETWGEGTKEFTSAYKLGCTGVPANPCMRTVTSTEAGRPVLPIEPQYLPQGIDKVKVRAADPLGAGATLIPNHLGEAGPEPYSHIGEAEVPVKIDHTAPTLTLSGTLTQQASLGTAKPQYALKYSAADGTRESATVQTTFGAEGSGNGQFKHPADVALDPSENVWVADQTNNRIEKLNVKGEFLAAYGTLGSGNGQLSGPSGIEADEKGNIWVADTGNNRIEKFGAKGEYLTKFGTVGAGNGQLSAPKGVAIAGNGNVWVADTGNNRIEEFSSTGTFIGAFGAKGSGNLQFSEPTALDIGPTGNVWIADAGNNRIEVLNEKGEFLAVYGTLGSGNGQFNHPAGIDVDAKGNVYVLDQSNGRVEQLSERGEYLSQFGAKGTGSGQFTFSGAAGLTTNIVGEIWVTDSADNRVEEWNPPKGMRSGVRKVVIKMDGKVVQEPTVTCPQGGCPLAGEWPLHSGEYSVGAHTVEVIATDGVELSKTEKLNITLNPPAPTLSLSGALTEQASLGTALAHYKLKLNASAEEGSGMSGAGQSTIAAQITVDGKQVDSGEASCATETCPIVREWTLNSGEYAAGAHTVIVKATDRFGRSTNKELKITLTPPAPSVTLSGTLTEQATLGTTRPRYVLRMSAAAEEGTGTAGGPATYSSSFGSTGTGNGQFSHPADVAVDAKENLWTLDKGNNRIEEFNEKGEFLKVVSSAGSTGGKLSGPSAIAVDPSGNVWVADTANNRIEEFNEKGEFVAVIGKEVNKTKVGEGGTEAQKNFCSAASGNICKAGTAGSAAGQLSGPQGIAATSSGNIWVADTGNSRLEKFTPTGELLNNSFASELKEPTAVAIGPGGSIWAADSGHNRVIEWNSSCQFVRAFGTEGTGAGEFKRPAALDLDAAGNVFVGDLNNSRVEEFSEAGAYIAQFGVVGSGAGQLVLSAPMGLAVDAKGNVWGTDTNNNRIQRWRPGSRSRVTTEITLDGKQVDSGEAGCTTEACPISREWVLGATSQLVGKHTIVAKATDSYGQWTSKTRSIEIQPDATKPTVNLGGELANAPEGWVQQESYGFNATATDGAGYGVTSLVFRIDANVVTSSTQQCAEGACQGSISKGINMGPYSGGAHKAEVIATDGAGNSTTKSWTINVDPEGQISTAEATDTLEAVEATSNVNVVGPSQVEGIEGTAPGLSLEELGAEVVATGTEVPLAIEHSQVGGFTVEVPEAGEFAALCTAKEEAWLEGSTPEAPAVVAPKEACEGPDHSEGNDEGMMPIEVMPLNPANGAGLPKLVEKNAAVSPNTALSSDSVVRPLDDGGMVLQAIRDDTAPESYSYRVTLSDEQVLRSIDAQHAEVYYSGHEPAFSITAEPAHDAVGTAVPTTLTVDSRDVVTLHVNYKAGSTGPPFVYPITAGTGWQGGFRTISVEMDNKKAEPGEEEEEGSVGSTATKTIVRVSALSAPVASVSSVQYPPHKYKITQCEYPPLELDVPPHEPFPEEHRELLMAVLGGCADPGSDGDLIAAIGIWGEFHYQNGQGVWVNDSEPAHCVKWREGHHEPDVVHCGVQPKSSKTAITVRGDFKWPQSVLYPAGPSCETMYAHLNASAPHKEVIEPPIYYELGLGGVGDPCPWPAWPH